MEERELNKLVQQWVLGDGTEPIIWRRYSTDMAAAWDVIEKLKEKWTTIKLVWHYEDQPGDGWYCSVGHADKFIGYSWSAPRAICLAALKTVGVEV